MPRLAIRRHLTLATLLCCLLAVVVRPGAAASGKTSAVDCAKGQTISAALVGTGPVTIVVKGTCTDNVLIVRDDVKLQADPAGGGVTGSPSKPDLSTIVIDGARRVVVDGLAINGGRNGVLGTDGAAFAVRNSTIQGSGGVGILVQGARAQIDGNTISGHPSNGVRVDGGRATITNNTIEGNGEVVNPMTRVIGGGIGLTNAASALIGLTDDGAEGGNIVRNNPSDGIAIGTGSGATLRGNQVLTNGRYGVIVARAHANLEGNNLISGNGATGLFVFEGVVFQQPRSRSLPPILDTISSNGLAGTIGFTRDGIGVFDNAVLDLRGAVVTGNAPHGINASANSTVRLRTNEASAVTTISSNAANGIVVALNATAILQTTTGNQGVLPDGVYVTNNGRYGICTTTGAFGPNGTLGYLSIQDPSTITGNVLGQVNPGSC
jgi:hypothetical protein